MGCRILLFTGEGKGKSTAAFGMMARALGHGMHIRVIQFVKSDSEVGEQKFFSQMPLVSWEQFGGGSFPVTERARRWRSTVMLRARVCVPL